MRSRLLAAAVIVVSALVSASGAHAAGWDALGQLSPALELARQPNVAFGTDGSAWVIWAGSEVDLERISPNGVEGAPIQLDPGGGGTPQVVPTPSGGVIAAWWDANSDTVQVVEISAAGTPGRVRTIGSATLQDLALSIDGNGVASVAYMDASSVLVQRFAGGDLSGPPITVWSTTDANTSPTDVQLSTNSDGDSVITWESTQTPTSGPLLTTRHAALVGRSGSVGSDHQLVSGSMSRPAHSAAVITPAGDAYILYNNATADLSLIGELRLARLTSSDQLSDISTIDGTASVNPPDLAQNKAGVLTALWMHVDASFHQLFASRRIAADGSVSPPVGDPPDLLSDTSQGSYYSSLSELPDGSALAAMVVADSLDFYVQTDTIDPASGPGPLSKRATVDSSQTFESIASGADPAGDAMAVWGVGPHLASIASFGAYFDATGPTIDTFEAPTAGSAGDEMVFGTASSDRSGIKSTQWDFGDGGHAGGAIVGHTFATPGFHTVTVTVTDGVGNTTTRSQPVLIRAATAGSPAGPAGPASGTPPPGALKARLAGLHRTLHLSRHRIITLRLPAQPADAFGSLSVRANAGRAARLITLGSRQFPVLHGRRVTVHIRLAKKAVKLVRRRHGQLKATVRLRLSGFDGSSSGHTYRVTIRT